MNPKVGQAKYIEMKTLSLSVGRDPKIYLGDIRPGQVAEIVKEIKKVLANKVSTPATRSKSLKEVGRAIKKLTASRLKTANKK